MVSCHIKTPGRSVGATRESDRGCSAQVAWYIRRHGRLIEIPRDLMLFCRNGFLPKTGEGQQYMRSEKT